MSASHHAACVVSSEEAGKWAAYVAAHPCGSIYHSMNWRRVLNDGFGYPSHHLLVRDATGAIAGLAPLFIVHGLSGRRVVAAPFRDRGGPLWSSVAAARVLAAAIGHIVTQTRAGGVVLKTLVPYPADVVAEAGWREERHWVHSEVELSGHTWDSYAAALNRKVRHSIREAAESGMTAEDISDTPGAVARWYALHLATQRRLGIPAFPRRFFDAMVTHLGNALRIRVVRHQGADVAATLLIRDREIVMYAYSASHRGAGGPAGDLLLSSAIQWAIEVGAARFDMGSDAPSQTGLLFFKRKWLARQVTIPTYVSGSASIAAQDSSNSGFEFARAVLRRLPVAIYPATSHATKLFG